jgi:hypothetical protein
LTTRARTHSVAAGFTQIGVIFAFIVPKPQLLFKEFLEPVPDQVFEKPKYSAFYFRRRGLFIESYKIRLVSPIKFVISDITIILADFSKFLINFMLKNECLF